MDPSYVATLPPLDVPSAQGPTPHKDQGPSQKSITDFFLPSTSKGQTSTPITLPSLVVNPQPSTPIRKGSAPSERGFNFCNSRDCRYCPLLDKSGHIVSNTTGLKHPSMKKISCRSSNVVYAITCRKCGIQYVGQTLLRLRDRFIHHLRDISIHDASKSVGRHFSLPHHSGYKDININILEFIRAPPRSPQAVFIRNRVERNWTHILRSIAPQGLNMENPKDYSSRNKT